MDKLQPAPAACLVALVYHQLLTLCCFWKASLLRNTQNKQNEICTTERANFSREEFVSAAARERRI